MDKEGESKKLKYKGKVELLSGNRVTVVKEIREELGLEKGDKFWEKLEDNVIKLEKVEEK